MYKQNSYIEQGLAYKYKENVICSFVITLAADISIETMNKAVNLVLNRAEYYRMSFWNDNGSISTCYNPKEFVVESKYCRKDIPENQGDFLFYIACENNKLYFDYNHFLADGRGIFPFIREILISYINLKFDQNLRETPLVSSAEFDYDMLMEDNPPRDEAREEKNEIIPISDKQKKYVIRISYQTVKDLSSKFAVRPFSVILALLANAASVVKEDKLVQYIYTIDVREALHNTEALYNFVTTIKNRIKVESSLEQLSKVIDENISENKKNSNVVYSFAKQHKWLSDIDKLKLPYSRKKRVYEMSEITSSEADFWVSYTGDLLYGAPNEVRAFIEDIYVFVPEGFSAFGVEIVRLNDVLILAIMDGSENNIFYQELIAELKENGMLR